MHDNKSSLVIPGFMSTVKPAFSSLSGQQLSIESLINIRLSPKDIVTDRLENKRSLIQHHVGSNILWLAVYVYIKNRNRLTFTDG